MTLLRVSHKTHRGKLPKKIKLEIVGDKMGMAYRWRLKRLNIASDEPTTSINLIGIVGIKYQHHSRHDDCIFLDNPKRFLGRKYAPANAGVKRAAIKAM